jgi:hypothetical protein
MQPIVYVLAGGIYALAMIALARYGYRFEWRK